MKRFRYVGVVVALALALPVSLSAQNVARGSIAGTVYDTSGAIVPDAKVTVTSEYGVRETKAGPDGTFVFASLEPGKYKLRVEYTNFKVTEVKDITVRLNERTTVDVKLEPGAVTQTVTVTEAAFGVDLSTTTSGGTITADLFKNVAVGRNIADIQYLVAGVNDGLGTGRANPSISGATGLENLYIVNGINITNAGYGALGTYSTIYGSVGTGVQFDFIKEIQVKTSGFEAQYGQALGGVVNMITKSGGNAYHGGAYFFMAPSVFEAERKQPNAVRFNKGQETRGLSTYDVGGEIGGYLVKNRLFWYTGFNYVYSRSDDTSPSNFRAAALGEVPVKTRNYNYSAKVNFNLTANQNHQIEGSLFGDPSRQPFGPNRQSGGRGGGNGTLASDFAERGFSALDYGSRNWTVRYTGAITPSWLVNASFGWAYNKFDETGLPNIYRVQDRTEATPGAPNRLLDGLPTPSTSRGLNEIGGAGFVENTTCNNKQWAANATNTFRAWGSHQVDYGFEFQDSDYDWFHRRTGPDWNQPCFTFDGRLVVFQDALGPASRDCNARVFGADLRLRTANNRATSTGQSGFRLQVRRGAFTGQQGTTNSKYYASYVQDAWQMTKYITLKLGLRWEQQRIAGLDTHYSFTGNWAPRAGVIERSRVTPISRLALLLGRSLRDVVSLLVQAVIITLLALLFDLRVFIGDLLLAYLMLALIALMTSAVSYGVALKVKSEDALAPLMNTVAQPVLLLSGILLPLTFAPGWLQGIADWNPFSWAVDGTRALFVGDLANDKVWQGLTIIAVLAAAGVFWAARQFARSVR